MGGALPVYTMYTAIVINESDREKLIEKFSVGMDRVICHHMTLHMGPHDPENDPEIGSKKSLEVEAIGEMQGIRALRIGYGGEYSHNEVPHITLELNPPRKPFESNKIMDWTPVEKEIVLGTVEECP